MRQMQHVRGRTQVLQLGDGPKRGQGVDELLGYATLAAAGLVAAIALQPATDATEPNPASLKAPPLGAPGIVRLAPVEVAARRDVTLAGRAGAPSHAERMTWLNTARRALAARERS